MTNDGTNVLHGQGKGEVAEGSARARAIRRYAEAGGVACHLRTPQRIKGFFDGLELVDPGVVSVSRWRPDAPGRLPAEVDAFCGVARRP
ncbi:MAG TPA: SAM-dependent methyltransferase [Actinomycetes bacterium]|nr:SAM-dependent methyltransferase [Actinomycetes bacterium]